jgi:ABC-type sulfate/molybdate transport systems ATPase subunit
MRKELRTVACKCQVPSITVAHDQRDIVHVGDRVCLIEKGNIARIDEPEVFRNEKGI